MNLSRFRDLPNAKDLRLLGQTLLSARHRRLDPSAVGLVLEHQAEPVSAELITAFAEATSDPNPRYLGEGAVMPPLMLARLVLPLIEQMLVHPRLKMNILRMVHSHQSFQWSRPLHVGDRPLLRLRVESIEQVPAGERLHVSGQALLDGEVAGEARSTLTIRGRGRPRGRKPAEKPPVGAVLFRETLPTTTDQARRYAQASGDHNYIHVSRVVARLAGLPGPILHGMCMLSQVCGVLCRRLSGGDVSRVTGLSARFSSHAFPGETLTLVGQDLGEPGHLAFELLSPRGTTVMREGRFRYHP